MADLKYSKDMCQIAQKVLADGESLAAVCCELDITRTTLYEWRDKHLEFAAAIEKGLQAAQRDWERLGKSGISGDFEKFASAPWIFTMKNRFRHDYQDEPKDKKDSTESLVEKLIDKLID